MERPKCKLCFRTFANGRALGGHMKAHLTPLPISNKPIHRQLASTHSQPASMFSAYPSPASSSSRDSGEEENVDDKAAIYGLRENPRRSLKFSDPTSSSLNEAAHPYRDGEEREAESTKRRRKRARRQPWTAAKEEEEEEDAAIAMCLVMLSRDKWTAAARSDVTRHRCEVCNKAFRSSQALGGHRVTHRKVRNTKEEAEKYQGRFPDDESERIFECPYCFKVFGSGQALGGHKRSHLIGSGNGSLLSSSKAQNQKGSTLIDLNMPAPPEVEDDDRSVISDGDIAEPPGQISL